MSLGPERGVGCSSAMDNECPNCGGELTARPRRTVEVPAILRGLAGRIGSYHAQRKLSGVLDLPAAERDLISQIKVRSRSPTGKPC
ncbi:DUF1272 domain-containing protein [Rhodococcus qingshengii]